MIAFNDQIRQPREIIVVSRILHIYDKSIEYAMELRPHVEGHFVVNDIPYRLEWPRTPFPNRSIDHDEIVELMVHQGVDIVTNHIADNGEHPQGARITRDNNGQYTAEVIE